MPVRRLRHGRALLTIAGTVSVSMTGCPFTAANLVAIPPPPAPQCHASDDPNNWIIGSVSGGQGVPLTVTLSLQSFAVSGVSFANFFVVDGGALDSKQFDTGSLDTAQSVTLTITPNATATTVTIHTGATCAGAAKSIDVLVDVNNAVVTISAP